MRTEWILAQGLIFAAPVLPKRLPNQPPKSVPVQGEVLQMIWGGKKPIKSQGSWLGKCH